MIQNVSSAQPGFFLNLIRIQNMQGGRMSVPVNPAHAVYARFKHIQGVPSAGGGAPLFRLRILDNLIEKLLKLREQAPSTEQLRGLEERSVDALISRLQDRLRSHLLQTPPSFSGDFPETGMLIDLSA